VPRNIPTILDRMPPDVSGAVRIDRDARMIGSHGVARAHFSEVLVRRSMTGAF